MKSKDITRFAKALAGLAELFTPNKEISEIAGKLYFEAIKDLTIQDFEKACSILLNTHKFHTLPKPAEVRNALGKNYENQSLGAWNKVMKMIRGHGSDMSIIFDDPVIHSAIEAMTGGWTALADSSIAEMVWREKDFISQYEACRHRKNHSKQVTGRYDRNSNNETKHVITYAEEEQKAIERSKNKQITINKPIKSDEELENYTDEGKKLLNDIGKPIK